MTPPARLQQWPFLAYGITCFFFFSSLSRLSQLVLPGSLLFRERIDTYNIGLCMGVPFPLPVVIRSSRSRSDRCSLRRIPFLFFSLSLWPFFFFTFFFLLPQLKQRLPYSASLRHVARWPYFAGNARPFLAPHDAPFFLASPLPDGPCKEETLAPTFLRNGECPSSPLSSPFTGLAEFFLQARPRSVSATNGVGLLFFACTCFTPFACISYFRRRANACSPSYNFPALCPPEGTGDAFLRVRSREVPLEELEAIVLFFFSSLDLSRRSIP